MNFYKPSFAILTMACRGPPGPLNFPSLRQPHCCDPLTHMYVYIYIHTHRVYVYIYMYMSIRLVNIVDIVCVWVCVYIYIDAYVCMRNMSD